MEVIRIENLSKLYDLGQVSTGTVSKDLNRWWARIRGQEDPYARIGQVNDRTKKAGRDESVWALKDINFSVQRGEVVGIIGRNGAGKSTLLKIISRITTPTTGAVKVKGRIASLLEVGTGFHPEMTGRENIFMNGTLLGMTRKEVQSKLDQIIDFAGVALYIDTPVKRYSSGMQVRLGFAVAAYLEPEILIVDEVLAVGDAEFQKKAIGRMQEVSKGDGRTVLFVSHNMGSIAEICKKAILLNNGTILDNDNTPNVLSHYFTLGNEISNQFQAERDKGTFVKRASFLKSEKAEKGFISLDDDIVLKICIQSEIEIKGVNIGLALLDKTDRKIFTDFIKIDLLKTGETCFSVTLPGGVFMPGPYAFDIAVFRSREIVLDYVKNICRFSIEDTGNEFSAYAAADVGVLRIKCKWN